MKIKKLEIENFRSLKKVTWEPGDLNLMIGPNGSGKSNLILSLNCFQNAGIGELSNYIQSKGGMKSLIWNNYGNQIILSVILEDRISDLTKPYLVHYAFDLMPFGHDFQIKNEVLKYQEENSSYNNELLSRNAQIGVLFKNSKQEERVDKETIDTRETLLSSIMKKRIPIPPITKTADYLLFLSTHYNFQTTPDSPVRQPTVTRNIEHLFDEGKELITFLHTQYSKSRDFKTAVNDAMKAAFGHEFEELVFSPAGNMIQMEIRWKSLKDPQPSNVLSDGTLRFLFLISILANPNHPSLIAIDEPETGLHPNMFRIIAEYAEEASKRSQVLFTTHSAEFLSAFRGMKTTVTITKCEDGETQLKNIDEKELNYWLENDYSLGELYRTGELEGME